METKIKYIPLFLFTSLLASCQTPNTGTDVISFSTEGAIIENSYSENIPTDSTSYVYSWKTTYDVNKAIINNIETPQDYHRINVDENSFISWLKHLPINLFH